MAFGHVTREKNDNKSTRYYSDKQEKSVAKMINGKQTSNSGATPFQKGDIITDKWLIECKTKTTESESISIKRGWFEKNLQEAVFMGKPYTAIAFSFGDNKNHYIIDENMFQWLVQNYDDIS